MANPVIVFAMDQGYDGNSGSGAGPATPVTGTKARSRAAGSTRVGFWEASAPDLSLFTIDGSHVLKLGTGAGRQWSKVLAKKDTQQSVTGDMTASGTTVSATVSTGMTVGDTVRIAGAGAAAADLYTTIATIPDGVSFTTNDAASTTVVGAAVVNPKQVTLEDSLTLTTDTAWACGGMRETAMGATQLWPDLKPGWTVEFRQLTSETANDQVFTSTVILTVSGDTTNGRITIRGSAALGVRPVLRANPSSVSLFTCRAKLVSFEGFDTNNTAGTVLCDSNNAGDVTLKDVKQTKGTTSDYALRVTSAVTGGRFNVLDCDLRDTSSACISMLGGAALYVGGSFLKSGNNQLIESSGAASIFLDDSVFTGGGNVAINIAATAEILFVAQRITIDGYGKGILLNANAARGCVVVNNQITNCSGTGLEFPAGGDALKGLVDHNNFFGNATNRTNVSAGANDTALDPQYRNAAGYDFRTAQNARAKGWPKQTPDGGTKTSVDIGMAQRPDPAAGDIIVRVISVIETASDVTVQYLVEGGAADGSTQAVVVSKSGIPTGIHLSAIQRNVEAALRGGVSLSTLVGQEILC